MVENRINLRTLILPSVLRRMSANIAKESRNDKRVGRPILRLTKTGNLSEQYLLCRTIKVMEKRERDEDKIAVPVVKAVLAIDQLPHPLALADTFTRRYYYYGP